MAASDSVNDVAGWLDERLAEASPDLLRSMVKQFAETLMVAEADTVCGASYRQRSDGRVNSRNGYRYRDWDTRAGTVELAIPKLRAGSYFPEWLLERRRRAEKALVSVVATSYVLGVSTRRVEKLAAQLGITGLSKSQVSEMAKSLDIQVEEFRCRPLDAGPYTFMWLDALTQKVREGGRTVIVHALIAVGITADGQREVLGLEVVSGEDGAGWLAFLRSLVARGLSGVALVISDSHQGLVLAIEATLPGAAWQRCPRTTPATSARRCPSRHSHGCSRCCARSSISPTPRRCTPSSIGSSKRWRRSSRPPRLISTLPAPTCWRSRCFRGRSGGRFGRTTRRSG